LFAKEIDILDVRAGADEHNISVVSGNNGCLDGCLIGRYVNYVLSLGARTERE
jgi:hypothetical protein